MHKGTVLKARSLNKKGFGEIRLCTGEKITVKKGEKKLIFSYHDSCVEVPIISPLSKTPYTYITATDLPNTIVVYYRSSWKGFGNLPCAAGVILVNGSKLQALPGVRSESFVWPDPGTSRLVISRVEKSPFDSPCSALLDTEQLPQNNIESLYHFPAREPIIVESIALTSFAGEVHSSDNPGTGGSGGSVSHLYPWISPDGKRHGWAFAFQDWHVIGKKRPAGITQKTGETSFLRYDGHQFIHKETTDVPRWLADRHIFYDGIDWDQPEYFDISLGGEQANFSRLNKWRSGIFQFNEVNLALAAYHSRKKYLKDNKIIPRCECWEKADWPKQRRVCVGVTI
ncbi:MAG: hypothetical protein G01um10143_57 [Parcubacteria group bacterium Gr01-1014_3]|nr:MAG: hypothetical protein G01um10143_57 [Parcubacteria group bacterium Gr01-1014_3]